MKFPRLEESDGGVFVKLKDGESIIGVPRGEIFSFKIKWENGTSNIIPEKNPAKHNRFAVNLIVKAESGYVAKKWEFGVIIYNTLSEFAENMDLTETKLKITRKGTSTDTTYILIPLGKVDNLKAIEAVKLNILDKSPKVNEKSYQSPPDDFEEGNFPPDDSHEDLPF